MSAALSSTCRRCGSTDRVEPVASRTQWRGRHYINNPAPADGPGECFDCRLEGLKYELRLGWDVHNHSLETNCGSECVIRSRLGRAWQIRLMREAGVDRTQGFLLTKAIDGMPKVNGTLQLQALRMTRFLLQISRLWYEPVPTVKDLVAYLLLSARLESAGVPLFARPHLRLVLQLYESAHTAPAGVISPPKSGEQPIDLHSVVVTGLSGDGKSVEFWNSWGSSWGVHGNGSVGIDYLSTHFSEAWCRWDGRWGLNWYKPELTELNDPKALRRYWMIENPMRYQRLRGTRPGDTWIVERFSSSQFGRTPALTLFRFATDTGSEWGGRSSAVFVTLQSP